MTPITAERGYVIMATDTEHTDYLACAAQLRDSILAWHPSAEITILTRDRLPFATQGGFLDDWQIFWASPYRQTIRLEADMVATSPVDHWWTYFEHRDVVISCGARNWLDRVATTRYYRKIFDDNHLPDVYNAITYWRRSTLALEFFSLVRAIFQDWQKWRQLLKFSDHAPTTDVVYAMAAQITGVERVTMPPGTGPTIVHMKRHVYGGQRDNWTQELIWERQGAELSIQTLRQWGFFHYHQKDWQ